MVEKNKSYPDLIDVLQWRLKSATDNRRSADSQKI